MRLKLRLLVKIPRSVRRQQMWFVRVRNRPATKAGAQPSWALYKKTRRYEKQLAANSRTPEFKRAAKKVSRQKEKVDCPLLNSCLGFVNHSKLRLAYYE